MKYIKEKEEKSVGSYLQFKWEENLKKEKEKKKKKKFGLDKNDELVAGSGNLVSEFYNEG